MFVELTNISHYFLYTSNFLLLQYLPNKNFARYESIILLSVPYIFCFLPLRLAKDFQLFGYEPQLSDPQNCKYDLPFGTFGGGGGGGLWLYWERLGGQ